MGTNIDVLWPNMNDCYLGDSERTVYDCECYYSCGTCYINNYNCDHGCDASTVCEKCGENGGQQSCNSRYSSDIRKENGTGYACICKPNHYIKSGVCTVCKTCSDGEYDSAVDGV